MKPGCPSKMELIDFLDGEMPHEESTLTAKHIALCESCAGSVRQIEVGLGAAKVYLETEGAIADGPSLAPAIMREVLRQRPAILRSRRVFAIAAAIAMLLAVFMFTNNPVPRLEKDTAVSLNVEKPTPEIIVKVEPDGFSLEERIDGAVRAVSVHP